MTAITTGTGRERTGSFQEQNLGKRTFDTSSPRDGGLGRLRSVTIASIAKGGLVGGGAAYERMLSDLYGEIDRPWQNDLNDFEQAMSYQRWPDQLRQMASRGTSSDD